MPFQLFRGIPLNNIENTGIPFKKTSKSFGCLSDNSVGSHRITLKTLGFLIHWDSIP